MARHPFDALSILRARQQVFDLVLSDYHMPNMTGLELQKVVKREFGLPVIIMSADDSQAVIFHCLHSGAVFYIIKPVDPNNLRNIWQYVVSKNNETLSKPTSIEETENVPEKDQVPSDQNHEKAESSVIANKVKKKSKKDKAKLRQKEGGSRAGLIVSNSRPKVVWTDDLHHRFLQAIDCLGWENAIPTRINDLMNVSGLTRENIASHLQKYRIFLKKVSQSGIEKLRDPRVANRLGVPPRVLSTIVEQRLLHENLHSSQQLYDRLLKLRSNPQKPLSRETGEASVGTMLSDGHLSVQVTGDSTPAVAGGNQSLNEGGPSEKRIDPASGGFVILDTSSEQLPDQRNSNNISPQINNQAPILSGDTGEDPLFQVIKDFDLLGANSFANIPPNGRLIDVVGTSQNFHQQQPEDKSATPEASASKTPMVDDGPVDQEWADFMDSLWRPNEDFSWD
ncbi:hypothetical protein MLD38_012802 [Melastoma candidum]|uniref:Uncharacterized protein n=1 Tax=Melastoma candidum TaxID=119954 RepID=A0ACB9RFY2_9MYRT|nr:hypothetical protein MLD38_012802 [Melastoma candidum]